MTLWLKPHSIASVLERQDRPSRCVIFKDDSQIEARRLGLSLERDELRSLKDASILIIVDQLTMLAALKELDGVARRIVIWPPDLDPRHVGQICREAAIDVIVTDRAQEFDGDDLPTRLSASWVAAADHRTVAFDRETEWVLFTSGTTGLPKLTVHTLATLCGAFRIGEENAVWGTFYDIRRYGGLQIALRSLIGGASLVLADAHAPMQSYLHALSGRGATHVSGTPTHWRKALMSADLRRVAAKAVRLSGEIADQPILDRLRAAFPEAEVAHAFASTEAGVAFEVKDGQAGFPLSYLSDPVDDVELKISNGALAVRSPRTARAYLGPRGGRLRDEDGYIDTGDIIEVGADRCLFRGRAGGVINVGGLKVHPEEVEATLNRSDKVLFARVFGKRSPVTGALVVAEVVACANTDSDCLVRELDSLCRAHLPAHKAPALIRVVDAIGVSANGKISRNG